MDEVGLQRVNKKLGSAASSEDGLTVEILQASCLTEYVIARCGACERKDERAEQGCSRGYSRCSSGCLISRRLNTVRRVLGTPFDDKRHMFLHLEGIEERGGELQGLIANGWGNSRTTISRGFSSKR